ETAQNYLGGTGLSAKLTYDLLTDEDYEKLKENPYSVINPLIFKNQSYNSLFKVLSLYIAYYHIVLKNQFFN
ncbi:MAG: hypothetical protein P8Y70_03805, partial [Candidatus Lokiarchaeota archaeon]